ncbi:MAG: Fur family transcriptional regulator [Candidatus Bipolaricaulia bacterium]
MSQLEQETGLLEHLAAAGYRLTAPRRAVLQVLEEAGTHLRPEEVLERARLIYPGLGRATVYRTLALLTGLGLLRPTYLKGGRPARLACVQGGYHHLVCLACGHSFGFEECLEGGLEEELARRFNFKIKSHLLEFYGLCPDCREVEDA